MAQDAYPLDLIQEAMECGLTRHHVITQLIARIERDQHYLTYRQQSGKQTTYDALTAADLPALALAVALLTQSSDNE